MNSDKIETNKKTPIIISFDGNIGSGKSSVVAYFKKILTNFVI